MEDVQRVQLFGRVHAMTGTPLPVLIPIRGPMTRGEVLDAGADDYFGEQSLVEGFAAQARQSLHRVAVRLAPHTLTTNLTHVR